MVSAFTTLAIGEEWGGDSVMLNKLLYLHYTADNFSAEQNFAELIQSPHLSTLPIFQNHKK
jgi:hypothetical protein